MTQMPMTTEMTTLHRTSPLAWHCTLSTLTSTFTESAHHELAQFCSLHISSHSHWLKFEPCPHSTHGHPHVIHVCDLFTLNSILHFSAFFLSFFLFPFFHLSDEQQPELNEKIMENLRCSATNGGEGTYDILYLPIAVGQQFVDSEGGMFCDKMVEKFKKVTGAAHIHVFHHRLCVAKDNADGNGFNTSVQPYAMAIHSDLSRHAAEEAFLWFAGNAVYAKLCKGKQFESDTALPGHMTFDIVRPDAPETEHRVPCLPLLP